MSDLSSNPLLALIKEQGLIDDLQLEEVLQEQTRNSKPIIQILQDFGIVELQTLLHVMAQHMGTEVVDLTGIDFTPDLLKTIPPATARMYQCLPVALFGSALQVTLADPLNPQVIDELAYITGKEVQLVVADPGAIEKLIQRFYGEDSESVGDILKDLGADSDIAGKRPRQPPRKTATTAPTSPTRCPSSAL